MRPPVPAEQARRLAEQELAKPEYHPGQSWLTRAGDAVSRFLERLLGGLGGGGGSALVVVGVLLLAVVLFAVVRAGRLPGRRRRPVATDDLLTPEPGTDHAARARTAVAEGRSADAIREWLRDAIATLEARDILDHRPGRTGAEAAGAGGAALPDAREILAAAAAAFDRVWFGGRPATQADVELAERAAGSVRTAQQRTPV